jgi:hypothetical protein
MRCITRWTVSLTAAAVALLPSLGSVGAVGSAPAVRVNPYSAAYGHPYRHGAVPTREAAGRAAAYRAGHPAIAGVSTNNLSYGGGVDGIGITSGRPRVYLVFWGSQWGSTGTDANGNVTLSVDPSGMAPRVQQLFKGIGVNELWSGVMTQYCEGVATGSQSCPSSAPYVGYPSGGTLAGVWADTVAAAPQLASGHQIGKEAVIAASHFGNTSTAANRNSQYVVVSPSGTNPDDFPGAGFCAWHDWNGDTKLTGGAVSSSVGDIAFTNLPYVTDAGANCGEGIVNGGSAGTLDGVTIVEGHEYAETITDQNPTGGWTDSQGAETGDKCAWVRSGPGAIADVAFSTGSFAMQGTWANDFSSSGGGCEISHPIVSVPSVANPSNQTSNVGDPVSLQLKASGGSGGYTWSASGLPGGLAVSSSNGLISGTTTIVGTFNVVATATDSSGRAGSTSFAWTVSSGVLSVANPGNQTSVVGDTVSLQLAASVGSGSYTWSASGLPGGLAINSASGLISGTATTAGTFHVVAAATDSNGRADSASFIWTVSANHLHMTLLRNGIWGDSDLTVASGPSLAAGTSIATYVDTNHLEDPNFVSLMVLHAASDNHLHMTLLRNGTWGDSDLTVASGGPSLAAGTSIATYVDTNHLEDPNFVSLMILHACAVTPSSTPHASPRYS